MEVTAACGVVDTTLDVISGSGVVDVREFDEVTADAGITEDGNNNGIRVAVSGGVDDTVG